MFPSTCQQFPKEYLGDALSTSFVLGLKDDNISCRLSGGYRICRRGVQCCACAAKIWPRPLFGGVILQILQSHVHTPFVPYFSYIGSDKHKVLIHD